MHDRNFQHHFFGNFKIAGMLSGHLDNQWQNIKRSSLPIATILELIEYSIKEFSLCPVDSSTIAQLPLLPQPPLFLRLSH